MAEQKNDAPATEIAKTQPTQTAVVVQKVPIAMAERGLDFKTFEELSRFCLAAAGSDLVPKDFVGKAGNIMVAIQNGMELGLAPMQALQNTAVINGRPTIFGDLPLGLCQSSPAWDHRAFKEWFEGEGDAAMACCQVGRMGGTTIVRKFGVKQAKTAKLWGKEGPWTFYPSRMLQMRARSFALRDLFSDVLRGMNVAPAANADDAADYADEVTRAVVNQQPSLPEPEPELDPAKQVDAVVAAMETSAVDMAAK